MSGCLKEGDTFQVPDPSGKRGHLWVVVSGPDADGSIVVANMTTHRDWTRGPGSDGACILQPGDGRTPGDHPFLRTPTVIAYVHAKVLTAREQVVLSGRIPNAPVSRAVLERIQRGALISDMTPQKIQALLQARGVKKRP